MSISRRDILEGSVVAALASLPTAASAAPKRVTAARLSDLALDKPSWFGWPDPASPAVVLKLGRPVDGGVGPERDVVAYSAVCTHLGCVVQVKDGRMVCPCHGSMFDPAVGGRCYQGPAPTALPRILLEMDADGTLLALGALGPVWGRLDGGGAP